MALGVVWRLQIMLIFSLVLVMKKNLGQKIHSMGVEL